MASASTHVISFVASCINQELCKFSEPAPDAALPLAQYICIIGGMIYEYAARAFGGVIRDFALGMGVKSVR
jgi:hypothetical protein